MAATQGYISGQEIPLDNLPSWKRELILRKRANARIHGAVGLPVPTPMAGMGRGSLSGPTSSTSSPLSGPQEATCSLSGAAPPHPRSNTTTAVSTRGVGVRGATCAEDAWKDRKYAVTSDPPATTVHTTMHHKGLHDEGPRVTSPAYSSVSDSYATEDEELRYGPGIVSKLKNRYMSLAMRESRSRPSLRRFSSLEDLLDSEPRGPVAAKPRAAPDSGPAHRREVMRRARSVDSLSSRLAEDSRRVRAPAMAKSKSASSHLQSSLNPLGKEDVIIIETSRTPVAREPQAVNGAAHRAMEPSRSRQRQLSSSTVGEEEDLPPPDTVRHAKRIFESSGGRPPRGTAARIAAHKAAQFSKSNGVAPASKPALKAKPAVVPPRKVTPPSGPTHPVTIEEAKVSLKKVTQVVRPTPRSTLSVRATAPSGEGTAGGVSKQEAAAKERVPLGLTPVTASVTAPVVNGDPAPRQARGESCSAGEVEEGVRRISSAAVSNIRSESHSQEFNFTDRSVSSPAAPKPASPTPSPLPASPIASHRVPSHPPLSSKVERVDESDRVHLENLKNVEKSRSPPVDVHTSPVLPPKVESPRQPSLNAVKQGKVESGVPDPRGEGKVSPKQGFSRKVESKPEVRSVGEVEPAKPSPPPAEELVRGVVGRGGLVEAFNKTPAGGSPGVLAPTKPSPKRWHQQENTTLVFNFTSSKKETPDYIENDGIDLSRRRPEGKLDSGYVIMPGWDGRMDSSTDGDDFDDGLDYLDSRPGVPPAPSGIVFEGEAVIINGRSNLQRQPRTRKLKISFDDTLTSTYEYPSENYLLEEAGLLPLEPTEGSSASQGGLASYTPSKIQIGSTFELGVSRTAPTVQTSPPAPPPQTQKAEDEYLRPADESETVTWSAESTSDMLF
ncbi:nascent polypeptide-associated complex subunit alpha, muscle-specific form-like isoform X1 [Portunus trituberculatus]|uniref:nascent polypeptide-associated complex subunit alpha, muscle-specific form-like isoform X1 n=1 Tax=Portunus trituberculatus TaxID=210409 RepID=UPI001E1CF2C5|nr:nascent polypeptide-associated complex subunit alpha, muscle-specific form-like isoform X1 [Portunus trituberculatus]